MAKKKKETVIYREKEYEVMERNEHTLKLTNGVIHFWVKAQNVKES